jgi:hypothetical protein
MGQETNDLSLKALMNLVSKVIEIITSAQNMGREDIHSLRKFPSYLISATYAWG